MHTDILPGNAKKILNQLSQAGLITVSARGDKKDFVDLYFLLQDYSLPELFNKLELKYPQTDYHQAHILKSLVYFTDADLQPMPRMHQDISWDQVKEAITKAVRNFRI